MAEQVLAVHRLLRRNGSTWGFVKLTGDGTSEGIVGFRLSVCRGPLVGKFKPVLEGTTLEGDLMVGTFGIREDN